MKWIHIKTKAVAVAAFAAGLTAMVAGAVLLYLAETHSLVDERIQTYDVTARAGNQLQHRITHAISSLYPVANWVMSDGGATRSFSNIANTLRDQYPSVSGYAMAPNGSITRSFPASQKKALLAEQSLAKRAVASAAFASPNQPTVFVEGDSLYGCLPVFEESRHAGRRYWGFVMVRIELASLIHGSGIESIFSNNYRYTLSDLHSDSQRVLLASSRPQLQNPASVEISFYNGLWQLSAMPSQGWGGHTPPLGWGVLAALSLLVASFALLALERKRLAATDALHDPLTGLPNRTLLGERGAMALAQARRNGRYAALMFLDLDGFKPINDEWGHSVGDAVLSRIGERLTHALRGVDVVGRVGGDEFVVVLSNLTEMQYATAVAQKLIATITEPMEVATRPLQLGVSIGISLYPHDGTTFHELLDRADMAMYQAKRAGGDQFRLADIAPPLETTRPQPHRIYPAP